MLHKKICEYKQKTKTKGLVVINTQEDMCAEKRNKLFSKEMSVKMINAPLHLRSHNLLTIPCTYQMTYLQKS